MSAPFDPPIPREEPTDPEPDLSEDPADGDVGYRSGDVLMGKYELERLAGEGSMGEVWLAQNRTLDMPVAIKLLRGSRRARRGGLPTLGEQGEAQLLREAQATAKLSHSAIVRVFDFGLTDLRDPFIVMERLEGEDLRDRLIREGHLDPVESVALLLPVIHGMHAAHVRGIVHRDIKPENIFLAKADNGTSTPKLVDFGIADLPWISDEGAILAGTPLYMAPEHAAFDSAADHRVDVWAMGVVLYELIAGVTPAVRTGENPGPRKPARIEGKSLLYNPPALGPEAGVDDALWSIIAKSMRPMPERWKTMRDMGEALANWLIERGIEEDSEGNSLRARWFPEGLPSHRPSGRPAGVSLLLDGDEGGAAVVTPAPAGRVRTPPRRRITPTQRAGGGFSSTDPTAAIDGLRHDTKVTRASQANRTGRKAAAWGIGAALCLAIAGAGFAFAWNHHDARSAASEIATPGAPAPAVTTTAAAEQVKTAAPTAAPVAVDAVTSSAPRPTNRMAPVAVRTPPPLFGKKLPISPSSAGKGPVVADDTVREVSPTDPPAPVDAASKVKPEAVAAATTPTELSPAPRAPEPVPVDGKPIKHSPPIPGSD